jgi:glycosyltransferase involved in cell wall biosynthesis
MTYNRALLLETCLKTLVSQKYPASNMEIIVVDDGSTDNTKNVAEYYCTKHTNVRYLFQKNKGIAAARNKGIQNATGEILAFVADDYLFPDCYAGTIITIFSKNPTTQAVRFKLLPAKNDFWSSAFHLHDEVDVQNSLSQENIQWSNDWKTRVTRRFRKMRVSDNEELARTKTLNASGAAAYRKEVFQKTGLFDERLKRYEDVEFAARMRDEGIQMFYCGTLAIRRVYGPTLLSEIKRSFWDGYYDGLCQDISEGYSSLVSGAVSSSSLRKAINQFIKLGTSPLWRARQSSSAGLFVVYLPLFFFLEFVHSAGLICSLLWKK